MTIKKTASLWGVGQKICRPTGPVRWALGGGAAPQPLQGTGGAIAVPRRLCEVALKFVEYLIGVPEGPTRRRGAARAQDAGSLPGMAGTNMVPLLLRLLIPAAAAALAVNPADNGIGRTPPVRSVPTISWPPILPRALSLVRRIVDR